MKNELCVHCDGRGFHWQGGFIIDRQTGKAIADTYKQGNTCVACKGSGKRPAWLVQFAGCIGVAAIGIAALIGFMAILP